MPLLELCLRGELALQGHLYVNIHDHFRVPGREIWKAQGRFYLSAASLPSTLSHSIVLWQCVDCPCYLAAFLFLCFFCLFLLLFSFPTLFYCQSQGLTSAVSSQGR